MAGDTVDGIEADDEPSPCLISSESEGRSEAGEPGGASFARDAASGGWASQGGGKAQVTSKTQAGRNRRAVLPHGMAPQPDLGFLDTVEGMGSS
jgi:hypothetical protein